MKFDEIFARHLWDIRHYRNTKQDHQYRQSFFEETSSQLVNADLGGMPPLLYVFCNGLDGPTLRRMIEAAFVVGVEVEAWQVRRLRMHRGCHEDWCEENDGQQYRGDCFLHAQMRPCLGVLRVLYQ